MLHKSKHVLTWYYEAGFVCECDKPKCIINKLAKIIRKRKLKAMLES